MIRFRCPQCRGTLEASECNSGEEINCLGCGHRVQIPPPPDDYFRFLCPSCGKRLKAKPVHSGKKTHCINCGTHLIVPKPQGHAASKPGPGHAPAVDAMPAGSSSTSSPVILVSPVPPSPESAHRADSKACPFCGEQVLAAAKKCKHCGEMIDAALRAAEEDERTSETKLNQASLWKIAWNLYVVLTIPLVGAVAGFLFVRIFMFDEIAEIGWNMFWNHNSLGNPHARDLDMVFSTAIFKKLVAGTFIGFVAGLIIAAKAMVKLKRDRAK